jgi:tetratricopeptide (TPR) repeat protein
MDEAAAQYGLALKLDPGNSEIGIDFGILRYKEALYAEAAGILEPIVNAHPQKGQALLLLADCYLRLGKFHEAIALLDPIYAQDAGDRTVNYLLGMALISSGEVGKGSVVIDRVMRDGGSATADLLIGAKLLAIDDHHGAVIALDRATAANPNLPSGWSLLGRALLDDGDPAGAQKAFRRALDGDPNDFDANLYLGGMLRYDGKFDEALPYLQKAFSLRPDSPQAAYQMGAIEAARGDLDKALGHLEPLEKKWPEFQQVHVQLALIYQKQHRAEESRREQKIVVELDEKARQQRKQMPPAH